MIHSLLLGLIQGITEFLPISSSGHLALAQSFFGFTEPVLAFDVALHGATMAATLVYFRRDVVTLGSQWFFGVLHPQARRMTGWFVGWAVIFGTLITVAIGLPLKPLVERLSMSVFAVGVALIVTGLLLLLADHLPRKGGSVSIRAGSVIGVAQGMAVIPGISRSGVTIVAGLLSRLSPQEAFRFSFLLSLPAIAGAMILELSDFSSIVMPPGWSLGVLCAGVSGYGALCLLHRVVTLGRWRWCAWYCLVVGGTAMFLGW
ncbi:MAG: bacitracin resistance protein [Dethiosulfovibrio peptidovorans]|nr:MAG: bacitracin resistance protein [Dethiosulfovibrio peptidovorans]